MDYLKTADNYEINIWVYNHVDYSTHIFVCKRQEEHINSSNSDLYSTHGRDAYETLKNDCQHMSRQDVIRMFF